MYIANHYVRINGEMYLKDESIDEVMSPETIEWLLSCEAIREVASTIEEITVADEIEEDQEDIGMDIDALAGVVVDAKEKKTPRRKKG